MFDGFDIRTISNGIDTNVFKPIEIDHAREMLDIKTDKKVILVGAADPNNFYKGFSAFIECLNFLNKKKCFLCFFGTIDTDEIKDLGFEYKSLGYLHDTISIRLAYSAADIFVSPSIMEAFGKRLTEPMACGTPVICFDATGPKDIVTHKIDGYKAKAFEGKELAKGIEWGGYIRTALGSKMLWYLNILMINEMGN